MSVHWHVPGVLAVCWLLVGCNECENGYKIKTEYKYVMGYEFWHESPKDEFLDGAIRVSTSSYKDGRTLTLRCFKATAEAVQPHLDIRYVITAPLLKKVVPELEKGGTVEMVLSIDGVAAGTLKVRPISHDFGISFLGPVTPELIERIGAASKRVVAMPRQGAEKLDDVIEFGVADLAKHIEPVKSACGLVQQKASQPAPPK